MNPSFAAIVTSRK